MTHDGDIRIEEFEEAKSRRKVLGAIVTSGIVAGILGFGVARLAAADDDDDNSGHGSDDGQEDRDDDHSGPGGHEDDEDAHELPTSVSSSPVSGVTIVEIRDEAFIPAHIIIDPGQTVTWSNQDDDEHTATGAAFDTGELERGDSAQVRFDVPGTFAYVCQFHSHMQGSVTVRGEAATPVASPQAAASQTGAPVDISIVDFAFDPALMTISAGTKVIWTNDGDAQHTVTGSFYSSDLLQPGAIAEFVFGEPGTYRYVCALHAQMSGEIIVE
jgi:plastocyanin